MVEDMVVKSKSTFSGLDGALFAEDFSAFSFFPETAAAFESFVPPAVPSCTDESVFFREEVTEAFLLSWRSGAAEEVVLPRRSEAAEEEVVLSWLIDAKEEAAPA